VLACVRVYVPTIEETVDLPKPLPVKVLHMVKPWASCSYTIKYQNLVMVCSTNDTVKT
jgi:hypothetical protein